MRSTRTLIALEKLFNRTLFILQLMLHFNSEFIELEADLQGFPPSSPLQLYGLTARGISSRMV